MNISVKGEYALQAIFDLAMQSAAEPVKIAGIAAARKSRRNFLELILSGLKQGGFVGIAPRSRRRLSPRAAGRPDHRGRSAALYGRREESEAPRRPVPLPMFGSVSTRPPLRLSIALLSPSWSGNGKNRSAATYPTGTI
jgi:hypothetical protein